MTNVIFAYPIAKLPNICAFCSRWHIATIESLLMRFYSSFLFKYRILVRGEDENWNKRTVMRVSSESSVLRAWLSRASYSKMIFKHPPVISHFLSFFTVVTRVSYYQVFRTTDTFPSMACCKCQLLHCLFFYFPHISLGDSWWHLRFHLTAELSGFNFFFWKLCFVSSNYLRVTFEERTMRVSPKTNKIK